MTHPQKRPPVARQVHESREPVAATAPAEALPPAASPLRLADGTSAATGSPARVLQVELAASFAESGQSDRLPPGPLVVALGVVSLIGWTVIILAARATFF